MSGKITDVRLIYQGAIKANAFEIIGYHKHPYRNLNPAESDTKITQKTKKARLLIDIQLFDHLILNLDGCFYSFADDGLL